MATTGDRLKRAQRLVTVQEQMRKAAEIALAATRARAAEVEADRARLLAALASSDHGPMLLEATARRLRGLATQATAIEAEAAAQAAAVRERGLGQKRAEALAERRTEDHRRESDKRDDLERLDGLAARLSGQRGRPDASLP
ncbi:hypothetical protein DA075_26060 [Methylobacterium currus]|uniref:Flagellar FliJ protein n=1 Tax=Methylobacterium currus TaxID=2051553 RepID=A0A2R4WQX2_9HYPH|nr:hypothetical protein [Methylobacterium currus]AWB23931.1 hypothetical protein DA075_26060 [Methylobacterium currus]UHC16413.1 hypothetical protein LRS73_00220 [Methylobacterium currus]